MKNRSGENGQVIVLVLMSMGLLLGVMALAIDVGVLFKAKRNVQIAADSAAFAGALDYFYNHSNSTAETRGTLAGEANGMTSSQITVNSPPVGGPNAGKESYVEAIVIQPNNTLFMGYLSGISSINVAARAVAAAPVASSTCMYIMNPTADDALWIHGAGAIVAPTCGIYVNSSAGDALCVTGSAEKSTFPYVGMVGQQGGSNCKGSLSGKVYPNSPPESDPFSAMPDPASQCNAGNTTTVTSANATLLTNATVAGPGFGNVQCYSYIVTTTSKKGVVTNTPTQINLTNAHLGSGNYVFLTGVNITGTDCVGGTGASCTSPGTGGGALLEVANSPLASTGLQSTYTQDTNSTLNIYSAQAGTYNGVALMQSPADSSDMMVSFGSSTETFYGMIYAPSAALTLHDEGGGGATATGVVAGTLYVNGVINISSYNTMFSTTTPFRVVTMVE